MRSLSFPCGLGLPVLAGAGKRVVACPPACPPASLRLPGPHNAL